MAEKEKGGTDNIFNLIKRFLQALWFTMFGKRTVNSKWRSNNGKEGFYFSAVPSLQNLYS